MLLLLAVFGSEDGGGGGGAAATAAAAAVIIQKMKCPFAGLHSQFENTLSTGIRSLFSYRQSVNTTITRV